MYRRTRNPGRQITGLLERRVDLELRDLANERDVLCDVSNGAAPRAKLPTRRVLEPCSHAP